jgi:hypothetical protein
MVVAVMAAIVLYPLFPGVRDEYLLVAIVTVSMVAALAATFLTAPVPRERLEDFAARVRPPGCWAGLPGAASRETMLWLAAAWIAGNVGIFALMFGIGNALLGGPVAGVLMVAAGAAALMFTLRTTAAARAAAVSNVQPDGHALRAVTGRKG